MSHPLQHQVTAGCWEKTPGDISKSIIGIYHKSWKLLAYFNKKLHLRSLWLKDQSNLFAFLLPRISAGFVLLYMCPCTVTTWEMLFKTQFLELVSGFGVESVLFLYLDYSRNRQKNRQKDKLSKYSLSFFFFSLMKGIENNESLHDKDLLEISF